MKDREVPHAVLFPGAVLPAALAYADLIAELGDAVDARLQEPELYAAGAPGPDWNLDREVDAVIDAAAEAGFERFHFVGYSAGATVGLLLAARHPERILSLALLEAAWAGNTGRTPAEERLWQRFDEIMELPPSQLMAEFVRANLAPGVPPPPPPPGPPPPWMRTRPAGLAALAREFARRDLDIQELRHYAGPVLYALGALSNPDHYAQQAQRLAGVFADFTLEIFEERHHFDPPHRAEPARLAQALTRLWARAGA